MLAEVTCGGWSLALAGLHSERRKKKRSIFWTEKPSNSTWSFLLPVCCGALWFLLHLPRLCRRVDNSDGAADTSVEALKMNLKWPWKLSDSAYRFFLSRDLCVADERITLSLGHLVFSCLTPWTKNKVKLGFYARTEGETWLSLNGLPVCWESGTISRSFRSARSSLSCCSSANRSPRGITKKMS